MKTINHLLLLVGLTTGLSLQAADPPAPTPAPASPAAPLPTNPVPAGSTSVVAAPSTNLASPAPAVVELAATNVAATNLAGTAGMLTNAAGTNLVATEAVVTNSFPISTNGFNPPDTVRLNFHGVPLEMVLNYLSEAAGFIIVPETDLKGKVDVWSNQPVTKDEAVELLNTILRKNGYAVIRNERTLTIVSLDAAKTRDLPVKRGNEPKEIPKNDEIVTQIIPLRYINAAQVTKDLTQLMPLSSTMSANEAANALVITDTQASIRRMAEIVKALDTPISIASAIRVYPLKFADAKTVATVVKDLFQQQDSGQRNANDMRAQFFQRMRGGGGPGGGGGGGGDQGGGGSGGGRNQPPKVLATSDDRSNSLVVSAPEEMIVTIDELVKAVDVNVEDITEVRVFRLVNADPVEMADLLYNLFPDDTRTDGGNRGSVRFGGGMFGRGGGGATAAANQSDRMKKMGRVIAVPDQRTASVVVSASRDLMVQIEEMIIQLDTDAAKKQHVYVFPLENADAQQVEQMLRNMFDRNGTMNNRSTANQNSQLNTRASQTQTSTGTGTTFGASTSGNRGTSGGR